MMRFNLDPKVRKAMATRPRAVQVEIARLANLKVGYCPLEMRGIGKYEGGVQVREREIAIHTEFVVDDWIRSAAATDEECAVVEAITDLAAAFQSDQEYLADQTCPHVAGDPLRELLGLSFND